MQKNQIPSWLYFVGGWMVVIGYIQYFFYSNLRNLFYLGWDEHMYRLFSTFLDPNFAAAFFVLFTIFLLGGIFREAKTIGSGTDLAKKILLLFSIGAALLTFSRSGLIMLIVSLILLFLLENRKKLILLVIISLGIFVLSISRFFYLENINLFRTASTNERIKSAQQATQIIVSNPIFGVGFNAYRYAQVSMGFRMEKPPIVSHADSGTDNSWLFILATTGIVGAVFFCNFIYRLFNSLIYKSNGKIPIFTVISLITFIGLGIDSIFINSLFYPPLMLWMWVILGLTDYK